MQRLAWYVRRISVMGPAELFFRARVACGLLAYRASYGLGLKAKQNAAIRAGDYRFCRANSRQLPQLDFEPEFCDDEARGLLRGRVDALSHPWEWRDHASNWHRAPDTGRLWPRRFFGSIDYRAGNPYGDVRVAWEPGRLQQLVDLALLAETSHAESAAVSECIAGILRSWHAENPPGCGIHYISSMECALRLLAVLYAIDMIRSRLRDHNEVWRATAQLVASHAELIEKRLSLYSSAGNHTIAECAGLVHAGLLFPEFRHAARWRDRGLKILTAEAQRQVLPDGGGIEMSTWYHLFVTDLLGLTQELLSLHRHAVPRPIREAVQRGRSFLTTLARRPAELPRFGDADDGYALSRRLRVSWGQRRAGASLHTHPDFGLSIADAGGSRRLYFLHGPLGMAPAFGHGHADALAVCLESAGRGVLIDTGTFTYTGDRQWRDFFRGTEAHNTLRVDGEDQARQLTAFQWARPYTVRLESVEQHADGSIRMQGAHDAYRHLGIGHSRRIVVVPERFIVVHDVVTGTGRHDFEINWHVGVPVEELASCLQLQTPDGEIRMRFWPHEFSLHRGQLSPPVGWASRRYGQREPILTIKLRARTAPPREFTTILEFTPDVTEDGTIELLLAGSTEAAD